MVGLKGGIEVYSGRRSLIQVLYSNHDVFKVESRSGQNLMCQTIGLGVLTHFSDDLACHKDNIREECDPGKFTRNDVTID